MVRAYATVDLADYARINARRWYLKPDGYAVRNIPLPGGRQTQQSMHRAVLSLGYKDPGEVDHIDSTAKLDNRRSNLRLVTHAQNMQNQGSRAGTSRFRGVFFDKSRKARPWVAYACVAGRQHYLGAYAEEEEAAAVSAAFRREHMPFSAEAA